MQNNRCSISVNNSQKFVIA